VRVPTQPTEAEERAFRSLCWEVVALCLLAVPAVLAPPWLNVHRSGISALAASPAGPQFAVCRRDGTGEGWAIFDDLEAGPGGILAVGKQLPQRMVFSPDGKTLALAEAEWLTVSPPGAPEKRVRAGLVRLWDVADRREKFCLRGHRALVVGVVFNRDGRILFSADSDGAVRLWESATGRECGNWQAAPGLQALSISPDGEALALGYRDGSVSLRDPRTGLEKARFPAARSAVVVLDFAGKTLITAGRFDSELKLWDVDSLACRATLNVPASWITSGAVSRGGLLAVGGGSFSAPGWVKVFDVASGAERFSFSARTNTVTAVAFSADGKALLAGTSPPASLLARERNGDVQRWEMEGGRALEGGE
jgi:hypothetical protein